MSPKVQPDDLVFDEGHPFSLVRGGSTLPPAAFLKSLPCAIAAEQRLTLDAIWVASDLAASAYVQLVVTALDTAADTDGRASAKIFLNAWAFVDQIYALRNLLQTLEPAVHSPKYADFMNVTLVAGDLRNRTDHLHQRIAGIANKKGAERSLFGNVSYVLQPLLVGDEEHDALVVVHHMEPVRSGEEVARFRTPDEDFRFPVGNFAISADGKTLDIDACVQKLSDLMLVMNEAVKVQANLLIERLSAEHDVPKENLAESFGAGLRVRFKLRRPTGNERWNFIQSID